MENKLCACGCGGFIVPKYFHKRLPAKFISGHYANVQWKNERHRKRMSKIHKAQRMSPEVCVKISKTLMGHSVSEITRQKIRDARLKQIMPRKDSSIEVKLQNELLKRNLKHKKHLAIFGQPDIAFPSIKLCVFADGDFFHGNPKLYNALDTQLHGRTMHEIRKKDKRVTKKLQQLGWTVLRFWEKELNNDIKSCVDQIEKTIQSKNQGVY